MTIAIIVHGGASAVPPEEAEAYIPTASCETAFDSARQPPKDAFRFQPDLISCQAHVLLIASNPLLCELYRDAFAHAHFVMHYGL